MACINRTVEEVESLIDFAKLSSSDLLPLTQTLEFPSNYNSEKYILMQLPQKLVTALKKGDE